MKSGKVLWLLAALNAALLLALVWKLGGETPAQAQPMRNRGEFIMVPSDNPVMGNGVIYMIDTQNGILSGFAYDQNARVLIPMAPINLSQLFMAAMGGGR